MKFRLELSTEGKYVPPTKQNVTDAQTRWFLCGAKIALLALQKYKIYCLILSILYINAYLYLVIFQYEALQLGQKDYSPYKLEEQNPLAHLIGRAKSESYYMAEQAEREYFSLRYSESVLEKLKGLPGKVSHDEQQPMVRKKLNSRGGYSLQIIKFVLTCL